MVALAVIGYLLMRRSRKEQQEAPDWIPSPAMNVPNMSSGQGPTQPSFSAGGQVAQDPFATPPAHAGGDGYYAAQQPQMGYFTGAPLPVAALAPTGRSGPPHHDDYEGDSQLAYMDAPSAPTQPQYGVTGVWDHNQHQQQNYPTSQYPSAYHSDAQSSITTPSMATGPSQSLLPSAQRTNLVYSGLAEV